MKEFIKAEGITTRIRMMRTAGHTGAFLLVEGDDDAIFFREFVDRTCRVQIGYGKDKVETAIGILDGENFLGVLGIVDADADILEGKTRFSPNLIWTDLRDIEMMFIRSRALDRLLDRFANPEFISPHEVRTRILAVATPIGYWRWLSFRKNLALDFKTIELKDFVDEKTLILDEGAFLRRLEEVMKKPRFCLDVHVEDLQTLKTLHSDPWHLCRGHDVVQILGIGLRRVFSKAPGESKSKNKPSELEREHLEKILSGFFHREDFFATALAGAISNWEAQTGFVVLERAA